MNVTAWTSLSKMQRPLLQLNTPSFEQQYHCKLNLPLSIEPYGSVHMHSERNSRGANSRLIVNFPALESTRF